MQKSILEKNPPVKNQVYKAEIFRNSSAVYDDMDPHQSVEYLIDIFKGKVDRDVIEMMFSECCLNVEETVESLMKLANEDEKEVNNNQSGYFDKSSSTLSLKMKNKMPKIIQISEMERSNANTCEGMKNELASTSFKVKENNPTPSTNFVDSIEANYYYLQNYNHLIRPNKGCVWSSDNVWNPPKSEVARPKITFQSIQHQIKDYQQRNYPNSGAFSLNSGVLRNAPYASRNFKTTNDGNIELVTLLIRNGKYRSMIILRGLPGSGKSYLAKYLASLDDHCIILSTDDFFNCNGKYIFDWTRLEAAHNWNQRRAKQAVLDGRGPIIIDNTNIEVWEMMPYVSMAKQFGYCLEILEPGTPWKFKVSALAAKNTHGVRKEKIAKMLAKYQYNIDADYFKKFDFKTDLNNDHKSVFDPKGRENGKQPILLEAVVHQEEQSPDALREKQNKSINTTVSPSVYRILRRDSLSNVTMNMDKSLVIKDNMISELKDVSNENKIINDLEELKSLVEADSDSQSLTKSDNKSSNQELSSLEEITEHKDLIWKTNSLDNIASFRCDTSSHEEASHSDKITSYDEYISLEVSKTVNFVEELPEQLPKNRESRPMQNCFSNILQRSEKHILQNVIPNNEIKGNDYATNTNLVQSEVTSDDIGNLLHIKKNCKVDSNQDNRQFLHIINSESDKHMNSKSISESEVNNSTVLRKRCTKSLDESSISQQIKNKVCKNTETNLLHSKFSSVPTIQNRLNDCKNSDDVSNGTENTSFIKKLTKNKEKEMALHKSPAAENCLSWNEDEDFNNKPDDLNKIFESENSCINQEKKQNEADSLLNFGSPKPQRKNVNICVLPKKFIETEDVKADLVNLNDSFKAGQLKDWETNIENNDHSSEEDKVSLMPKPPRVPVETQCKSETFNEIPKSGAKFDSRDEHNAPRKSQRQRSILSLPFIEKDWSFPEYVQNDILERKISSVDNISYSMSGTQTESEDFVLAYKIERKENYSSKYYILSSRNDQSNKKCGFNNHEMHLAVNIKKIPTFEKSTSTEDLIPPKETEEKLHLLQERFPEVSNENLNYLMTLCQNDENWVSNILLDSEFNIIDLKENDSHAILSDENLKLNVYSDVKTREMFKDSEILNKNSEIDQNKTLPSSKMPLMPDNISKVCAKNDLISDESQINSTDSSNSSRSNTDSSDTLSMQTLRFVLDPAFALQLEELFGPVIPYSSAAAIPVVKIDLEFAKLIYDKWKDSTENAVNKTDSSIKTDKKKQKKKNKKRNLNLNELEKHERNLNENTKEPTSLKEIMDHEEALEIHKKEKLKQDKDAATKLKRKQLYSMYPGADPVVLDEIFEANGYSLEKCEKTLEEKSTMQDLNLPKEEPKLQKSFDKTYSKIISDFETGNWKSWVSDEVNEPIADASTEAANEAETLRENAAEHRSQQFEFLGKARGYNDRGMKTVASYYFQQSSALKLKAKEENKSASQMIAAGKNASYKNTLDLHGLYVHEAMQALQTFLQRKKEQMQLHYQTGLMKLTIITGKGRHSFEQKAKIRPAVKEYLTSNGYRFIEIPPGFELNFKCDGPDYVSDVDDSDDSD